MSQATEYPPNLDIVLDVPVQVSVELGSTKMPLREVLELAVGSVVPLDKNANDAISLYANQRLVARGEVVVIEERFGIKITEVIGSGAP